MDNMQTKLSYSNLAEIETELLAVLAADTQTAEGSQTPKPSPELLTADQAVQAAVGRRVFASGEFKAAANETLLLHAPAGLDRQAPAASLDWASRPRPRSTRVRSAAGTAVRFTKPRGIRELVFALLEFASDVTETAPGWTVPEALSAARSARAAVEGALVGDFDPDTYRSDRKDQSVQSFTVAVPAKAEKVALEAAFVEGIIIGESQNFARSLVNEPGNKLTPTILGERAAGWLR
jgi:leucyl aminopeptidase